jgi:phosphatidylglycerol---prolipoprotein diacylglyceryl transferase
MLLASLLASLPSWTWDRDPVFLRLPKGAVAAVIAAFGVVSLLIGLKRKITDQTTTGVMFLAMAGIIMGFLSDQVELRYYSLLFVVVFLGGHALLNWQVKRGGGSPEVASDFIVYGVLGVLVGARLGHVLFYDLDKALEDPWWVFKIWTGGLASHGAVVGLILAMYLFTKKRGVPFLEGADRFAFSATLGATVVRIGNLMNSEIVGRVVPDQSWGMRFPRFDHEAASAPLRYPSQLFEITLGCLVFLGLFVADRVMGKEKRPRGALISWFFVLYFGGRLFTERYKEIEALPKDTAYTMGQYLSVPGLLLGVVGLWWAYKNRIPVGWVEPGDERDDDVDEAADEHEDEAEDEDDDTENGDDASESEDASGDPDVDAEFEDGKLKKRKGPPVE